MRLGYQANSWGGVVGHPVGVTSIKDLFYLTPGEPWQALDDIAAAGFTGVEMFDGSALEHADRLPEELEQRGLELIGVYSGANFVFDEILGEELWRIRQAADVAQRLGAEHLVVGGGAQRTEPATDQDFDKLGKALDEVVRIARDHGLTPSYHPHLSTMAESPEQIERALSRSEIGFCPDTGHLIAGGGDPAKLIRQYADRIPLIHLKDVTQDVRFVPLGQGVMDVTAVCEAIVDIGYDGWVEVELDGWDGDPAEGARINQAVLKQALGVRH